MEAVIVMARLVYLLFALGFGAVAPAAAQPAGFEADVRESARLEARQLALQQAHLDRARLPEEAEAELRQIVAALRALVQKYSESSDPNTRVLATQLISRRSRATNTTRSGSSMATSCSSAARACCCWAVSCFPS